MKYLTCCNIYFCFYHLSVNITETRHDKVTRSTATLMDLQVQRLSAAKSTPQKLGNAKDVNSSTNAKNMVCVIYLDAFKMVFLLEVPSWKILSTIQLVTCWQYFRIFAYQQIPNNITSAHTQATTYTLSHKNIFSSNTPCYYRNMI